ncbi:small-conductance mechanosensitive channel [Sphingomonas kaistensis]|uniref:Small-conductance mechanosensitive channel n=1 Tax=Sphingomonas kaistensis TaxID=298708 RepID=A0A7X5Y732_9SPHN|nr:mechanosensitive ion channel domain-containing protein [Sphingomonas kaistensis]NJC06418.1 small-conductance mechanosensitive channel [Sphingomonas kaistensis]
MNAKLTQLLDWISANLESLALGVAVAVGLIGLMLIARSIGHRIVASDPGAVTWKGVVGRVLSKTGLLFMAAAAIEIVLNYAELPAGVAHLFHNAFIIAFALQAAVWARELILGVIGARVGERPGETTLGNAMGVIRVLVSVAVFAIAIIVILDNLGVNVTALVAGLGIGGIAIGLAAQGIFSDLFAALAILFDKPFRRGDTIRFDTTTGTVEKIGLKTTRLTSLTGEQVIMANTKLLEREVRNLAAGHERQETLRFGLTYQTPPEKLERVPDIAREVVEAQEGCTLHRCVLVALGASSLDHELLFRHTGLDADVLFAKRAAILIALLRRFAAEGIDFAYPTQTTFTAAPDGTLVMPYAVPPPSSH